MIKVDFKSGTNIVFKVERKWHKRSVNSLEALILLSFVGENGGPSQNAKNRILVLVGRF